ncbi:MAG: Uma2 family endonuclease [Oscillatoria sp. PMC 1051.18]|nr:Uma2 family endonuclease [Oscillatoria sp. PMC 1050.18]MEC5029565.1 Uma2 family endonuclease [Oscillatoria sp. PMC 1051.18]
MQVRLTKTYYTPEEYLELEEKAESKHEYQDGKITLMAGGTTNHNKIAGNFYRRFPLAIAGQEYETYITDVRLWIPRYRLYTYPDFMAILGQPVFVENRTDTVTNPFLIVEVWSKSTKNYDQGDKFRFYRSIPELREYVLIDQYSFYVERFAKNAEGKWVLTEFAGEEAILRLESVDWEISFPEIYSRVNFELSSD